MTLAMFQAHLRDPNQLIPSSGATSLAWRAATVRDRAPLSPPWLGGPPIPPPSGVQGAQPPPGVQGGVPLFLKTSEGGAGGIAAQAKPDPPLKEGVGHNKHPSTLPTPHCKIRTIVL